MATNQATSLEDLCIWADGTWCYREDLEEMSFMSDDYEVVSVDDPSYDSRLAALS